MHRAYALLHVKAVDADRRLITGTATTPEPDRAGDIIESLGVTFKNPLPLLLFHDAKRPVGWTTFATPTADGIEFEATLPTITEPGPLRDRVEEAWQSVKAGLISGVSIGFRSLEEAFNKASGGFRFLKTEVLELSLVTVPANASATIHSVKALDLAAMGPHPPGATGTLPIVRAQKGAPAMTTAEQITQWSNTRAPKAARMTELMSDAATTGVTLDAKQVEEYEGLKSEVVAIDGHLARLREAETLHLAAAAPIVTPAPAIVTGASGTPAPVIQVKARVPPGTAFIRAACGLLVCKGNFSEAAEYTKRWQDSTPEVSLYLKAAVAAGNTTDATWAGPLVNQGIAQDFLELLRPATILGKISGLRQVPFNTKVPLQSAGGTYGWVGEAKPKPVTKLAFGSDSLGITKVAGIIVLTEELVRLSSPSAEALVRQDMIAGIAQFLDTQFIDPAVAAVAGVNPASITNGAPTAVGTVNPLTDILSLIAFFAAANIPMTGLTFIMAEANAMALSMRVNSDGSPAFPGVTINGGSYKGINVVTSSAAGTNVIGLQPSLILYADDGAVTIDASREASLQMDSAPASPADATTVLVSLWQTNHVGLRAERFINWKRANANAVKYLTAVTYAPSAEPPAAAPPAGRREKEA